MPVKFSGAAIGNRRWPTTLIREIPAGQCAKDGIAFVITGSTREE
jgi:hypothetical protein